MKKIFTAENTRQRFTRSGWISIQHLYDVTPRHSLYSFSMDGSGYTPNNDKFDPESGTMVYAFRYAGRWYSVDQFVCIGSMFCPGEQPEITERDGRTTRLHAVDFSGDLYFPLYAEFDLIGEKIRLYTPLKNAWFPRD